MTASTAKKRSETDPGRSSSVQVAHKIIELREQRDAAANKLGPLYSLSPVTCRALAARSFEPGEALENYLETHPATAAKKGLPTPETLGGLEKGVQLLKESIAHGEKIAIANDFDVDGLTGGVQIYRALRQAGLKPRLFVPHRFNEGYGLNTRIVDEALVEGCKLLITVDYGTTNTKEITYAQERGMKVIVIDHHAVKSAPPADAFINPQQCGFAGGILCASALAWYFISRARRVVPELSNLNPWEFIPYAGIGTICDMVPLIGPNRVIAKSTLALLKKSEHVGLRELLRVAGSEKYISCSTISFGIGPRINAAGRMLDGTLVARLLTTEDKKEASQLANELDRLNQERQVTEEEARQIALKKVFSRKKLELGIMEADPDFHTGVVGLVAQRLLDAFYLPTAILGFENGEYKGSIRGVRGFSVAEMISRITDTGLLTKGGGHEAAGGWSFPKENYSAVEKAFYQECKRQLGGVRPSPVYLADTYATIEETTPALVKELRLFEPFGMGNPGPTLLYEELQVKSIKLLKDAHLKVELSDGKKSIDGLMWRTTDHPHLYEGAHVRVAAKPGINEYRGTTKTQLDLQAVESA
ncbi:MAG: single-stranded-DNA-specific exonuclease RecJ [Bdellovibrionales bacterium]|nr:single-stranded-DNA-specific exonuclease RecJ [Bdellovibrionales bacterium]